MKKIYLVVMALVPLLVLSSCAGGSFFNLPDAPRGFEQPYEAKADEPEKAIASSGKMHLVNEQPYVRWQPGSEKISCIAGKIFRDYKGKKRPGECRLELVIYGGDREKVEDPVWFNNWLNNVQTIVEVRELNEFFANLDPNDCYWDENGNGGYHRWCRGMFHARFDLGEKKTEPTPSITEETLDDGRTMLTLSERAVRFDVGKWEIKDKYLPLLQRIAEEIQQYPGPVVVIGHTDNLTYKEGSQMDNTTLSEKRAEAVANALISCRVKEARMRAIGQGARKPIAGTVEKQTNTQRTKNRRVEIIYDGKTVGGN